MRLNIALLQQALVRVPPNGPRIASSPEAKPEQSCSSEFDLSDRIEDALSELPKHQARILRLYYGLGNWGEMSTQEICKAFQNGDSAEDVEEMRIEAIKSLQKSRYAMAMLQPIFIQ